MTNSITRRRPWPLLLMGAMILVAVLMGPGPAGATPMVYTYTSLPFEYSYGTFPATPTLGTNLTITFTYDGWLPDVGVVITDFTIFCGDLQLSSLDQPDYFGSVLADATTHLPVGWMFGVGEHYDILEHSHSGWYESSYVGDYEPHDNHAVWDHVNWYGSGAVFPLASLGSQKRYVPDPSFLWDVEPVPLPHTVLLLGSGLIPLGWFRRRNRGRK